MVLARRMPDDDQHATAARRPSDRKILAEASAIAVSPLEVGQTLDALVQLLVPRVADWCTVRLVDPEGVPQLMAIAHQDPAAVARARELEARCPPSPSERSVLGEVLGTGASILRPVITDEMLIADARSPEYLAKTRALGLRSSMIVALSARGRTFGLIMLATTERSGRTLDAQDLALAEEIAGRAALAVDNARLFTEVERAKIAAEEAAERLRILAEASSLLASSLDDEAALHTLASFAVRALADYAVSYTHEDDGSIRRVGLAHRDPDKQALVEALVRAGPPTTSDPYGAGAVIREGVAFLAPAIEPAHLATGAQNEEHHRALAALLPRSTIVVPLRARGRSLGALALAATDDSGRRYTEADLLLVERLAGDAALLVDNARLLRRAQEAVRARDHVVAAVSHDLRSPLHVISNGIKVLERAEPASEHRALTLRAMAYCADEMERFVVGLLDVARLEDGAFRIARAAVDARSLLADAVRMVSLLAEQKGIDLTIRAGDEPAMVDADAEAIRRALGNVLTNAVKFAPSRGRVRAEVRREGDRVLLRVEDNGPGIAEEDLPRLFDRFWQSGRGAGTGLGLAIAKGLVEAHGGEIRVESTLGCGSAFEIVLPAL